MNNDWQNNFMEKLNLEQSKNEKEMVIEEIKFNEEACALLLVVNESDVDCENNKQDAQGLGLNRKSEFHLTVIGRETGEEIIRILSEMDENTRVEKLRTLKEMIDATPWRAFLEDEFYYISKNYDDPDNDENAKATLEKRESIIQLGKIVGIEEFYKKLNEMFKTSFAVPLSHLTLYTNSTKEENKLLGIGVYSREQLDELAPRKL